MPTLDFSLSRMSKLVGKELTLKELEIDLQWIALDIEEIDYENKRIKIEYEPNRPDFASPEGIARTLRGYYEIELGMPTWEMKKGPVKMHVDPKVKMVRPYVVCAVIRNIDFDDEQIKTVMNIQEDLHHALGRGRKKVAIGVHDFDKVKSPFRYTTVKPDEIKFRPLQMERYEMSPKEILEEHPKGIKYAHILKDAEEYPMIFDAENNVVSFPPIINGVLTTVTDDTRNLFLDLTGTDFKAVNYALNILATTFADMGAEIEQAEVIYDDGSKKAYYPNFEPTKWTIREQYVNSYLGLNLSTDEMIKCLRKCRLDAVPGKKKGTIDVFVPAYRTDFMHEVDFTEEVAIGYNYKNIPKRLFQGGIGEIHPLVELANNAKIIMIGAGFLETINFILISKDNYKNLRLPYDEKDNIIIDNPVSSEFNTTRSLLLPGMMRLLQYNRSQEKPIKIFEVGDVVLLDKSQFTGGRQELHICAITHHSDAEYTEIKGVFDYFVQTMGIADRVNVKPSNMELFINGRAGDIFAGEKKIGFIGELHPIVLENFGLKFPTAIFEMDLTFVIPKEKIRIE
ncbi:MAG: phenylalanine--tRNA ligase subunit beta [Promethearchaeota archaeon]